MHLFCIGDLHLSLDPRVDKPMSKFGEIWENHSEKVKKNWIERVTEEDIVIIAGDISWGLKLEEALADLNFLDSLPGNKILIKGNHDLWWAGITKLNSMFDSLYFLQNKAFETEKMVICGTRGWLCPGDSDFGEDDEKIYKREALRLESSLVEGAKTGKPIVCVTHFPPTNDKGQPSLFTKLYEKYNVSEAYFGHLHTKGGFKKAYQGNMNGVNYKLISYDFLEGKLYQII